MLPPPNEDTRVAELTRRVENLESALRASFTTISGGGSLTIDGGDLRVKYAAADGGGDAVYVGNQYGATSGTFLGTGLLVQGPNGTDMIIARQDAQFGNTRVDIYDAGGRIIFGSDASSEQGLARPYLPGVFYRQRYADWVSTTAAAFEGMHKAEVFKQHPRMSVAVQVAIDDAATTGDLRVMVNGAQLGSTISLAYGVGVKLVGPANVAGSHMQLLTVEIQAQRTAGTGSIRVEPLHVYGRQSP